MHRFADGEMRNRQAGNSCRTRFASCLQHPTGHHEDETSISLIPAHFRAVVFKRSVWYPWYVIPPKRLTGASEPHYTSER